MGETFDVAAVMALCFAAWGFFHLGLHRRGIGYTNHFVLTTVYFTLVGGIAMAVFWPLLAPVLKDFSLVPIVALGGLMLVQLALYVLVPRYAREPREYFERYPDRYFLQLGWRRLISKSADIAAQQVFIIVLVVSLRSAGLALPELILVFGVLFMLLHIPLITSEWGGWPSFLFAGAVVAFSVTFPPLILFVPYGFIYNIMLHWFFYTATTLVFWLHYGKLLPVV